MTIKPPVLFAIVQSLGSQKVVLAYMQALGPADALARWRDCFPSYRPINVSAIAASPV